MPTSPQPPSFTNLTSQPTSSFPSQSLPYIIHHFESIKLTLSKLTQNNINITKQKINESIKLMQKKIMYDMNINYDGNNKIQQFQDYVTQYYQEEMIKLRDTLEIYYQKINYLESHIRELSIKCNNTCNNTCSNIYSNTYSNTCNNNNIYNPNNHNHNQTYPTQTYTPHSHQPHSSFTQSLYHTQLLSTHQQQSIKLLKQLSYCKQLIQSNKIFINQQNLIINELNRQIKGYQEINKQHKIKFQRKIYQYEHKIQQNHIKFIQFIQKCKQSSKIYQKQLKQLQLYNSIIIKQKSTIQQQQYIKIQQIKLLSKKIYDLQLIIKKYQREILSYKQQKKHYQQSLLIINKQMILMKNKFIEKQNQMIQNIQEYNKEIKKYQSVIRSKDEQIQKNKDKLNKLQIIINQLNNKINDQYKVNQINYQKKQKSYKQTIKKLQKQKQHDQIKYESLQSTHKKTLKQFSILQKQNINLKSQLSQNLSTISQLQLQTTHLNQQLHNVTTSFTHQKSTLKSHLLSQAQQLLNINKSTVIRLKSQENLIMQLNQQKQKYIQKLNEYNGIIQKMKMLCDEQKKRNNMLMKENIEIKDIIEIKEKQTGKLKEKVEKYQKIQDEIKQKNQIISMLQKQLTSINHQLSTLTQTNTALTTRLTTLTTSQSSLLIITTQLKTLKQQTHKKDFQNRQLTNKITLLQQQLRQLSEIYENQKIKMKVKITQLEELVKERYDFSNRPSNCG